MPRKYITIASLLGVLLLSLPACGAPVKLGCFPEMLVSAGAPPVILAEFDEEAKTAHIFVKDWGGRLRDDHADVTADMVMFNIKTSDGREGHVFISRPTGSLSITWSGESKVSILANCRKTSNAF